MKDFRAMWRTGWRAAIALALLAWILHSIFWLEAKRAWVGEAVAWESMPRLEQWRLAWTLGPGALARTLSLVAAGDAFLSLVFMGGTLLLGVVRWRMVLRVQGLELSLARALEISLVAHFFNSFLLGSTGGDVLKAYYAARETRHKKIEAVVTVVVDRVLGLLAMLLFACLMMIPNASLVAAHPTLGALAGLIVLMLLGCGGVVGVGFWGGWSRRFPSARAWLRGLPKGELFDRALDASRQFGREPWVLGRVFGMSMALNLCCVLQIQALAHGLGLSMPPMALLVIVPVVVCLAALPITPSGLGVRENLYVLMLTVPEIGVPATYALSLSLLAYAGSLFWSMLGGVVYLVRRDKDRLGDVAADRETPEAG